MTNAFASLLRRVVFINDCRTDEAVSPDSVRNRAAKLKIVLVRAKGMADDERKKRNAQ
jgi:hypothetical protein